VQVKTRVRQDADSEDIDYMTDTPLVQIDDLAPGQYVIQAKLDVDNDLAGRLILRCDLVAVATQLDTMKQAHDNPAGSDQLGYTLIGTFTASAAGTDDVFVRCTNGGVAGADGESERTIATLIN